MINKINNIIIYIFSYICRLLILINRKLLLNYKQSFEVNIPKGAKILAPNHPTTIDPFLSTLLTNETSFILIWEKIFKLPVLGSIISYLNHIPVDSDYGSIAYNEALKYISKGRTIIIFPEGRLSPENNNKINIKTGAIRLAVETGVPVIPIGIGILNDKIWKNNTTFKSKRMNIRLYSGPYVINVGKPIYYKKIKLTKAKLNNMCNILLNKIEYLKLKSEDEVYNMTLKKFKLSYFVNKTFSFLLYQLFMLIIIK